MYLRAVVAVVLGLMLAGCSPDVGTTDWAAIPTDSAGVLFVDNRGSAPRWLDLSERSSIGSIDGAAPGSELFQVNTIDVDGDRLLLTSEISKVSTFTEDGPGPSFGGRGQGPQEFSMLLGAFWSGDEIVAFDGQLMKVVIFALDSDSAAVFSSGPLEGYSEAWPMGVFGEKLFVRAMEPVTEGAPGSTLPKLGSVFALDLSAHEWSDLSARVTNGSVLADRSGRPISNELDTVGFARLNSDSTYLVALGPNYRIEERTLSGQLVRVISREFLPVEVDRDDYRKAAERRAEDSPDPGYLEGLLEQLPDLPTIPPVYLVVPNEDGGFWAQRRDLYKNPMRQLVGGSSDWFEPEPRTYDRFDSDGAYSGSVRLPDGEVIRDSGRDWISVIRRDELGVEYVVIYDVVGDEGA